MMTNETRTKLFDFLHQEFGIQPLESDLQEIEQIVRSDRPTTLLELEEERWQWAKVTFPEATALGSLRKAEEEIWEIEKDLEAGKPQAEEYVDAIMALFDSARRAAITPQTIVETYALKLTKNKSRTWVKNDDNSYSHVKPVKLDDKDPLQLEKEFRRLLRLFAAVLLQKLIANEEKYGFGNSWKIPDWEAQLQRDLRHHVQKGDPRDVAIYALFAWYHNWRTAPPIPAQSAGDSPRTVTITLSDEQFDTLADAAEFTSRFLSGQIDQFSLPSEMRFSKRYRDRQQTIDQALRCLKAELYPELSRDESYGVGDDQTTDKGARDRIVLYEVYRTMLEYRVAQKKAAGVDVSLNVYARPGLQLTDQPKPIIEPL